jgi:hypothetical protein
MSNFHLTGYQLPHYNLQRNKTGDWRSRVADLVQRNAGRKALDPTRATSNRTQAVAHECVMRIFVWLRKDLGFKDLANPYSLDERHFLAVARHIKKRREAGEYGAASAAKMGTYCRHVARWINKPELVKVFACELGQKACKRDLVADADKSWEAAGVDFQSKVLEIAKKVRWMAFVLIAQQAFGLRCTEALRLQPLRDLHLIPLAKAPAPSSDPDGNPGRAKRPGRKKAGAEPGPDEEIYAVIVEITDGSKGGRPRMFELTSDWAIQSAKALRGEIRRMNDGPHLPPSDRSLKQNTNTYQQTLAKFGLTKKALGVTGHGLRAGFACDQLEARDITPTVRGGDGQHADAEHQMLAYTAVTEAMGHGRISVIGAYAGSITPTMAARKKKKAERQLLLELPAQGMSAAQEMASHSAFVTQPVTSPVTQTHQGASS